MKESYLELLKLQANYTLSELKKAYRTQSKVYHPDLNKSPDAHEMFIRLREAFEYLHDLKTGKIVVATQSSDSTYQEYSNEEYLRTRNAEAKARAEHFAQMRYEEFIEEDEFSAGVSFVRIFELGMLTFAIVIPIILFVGMSIQYGWPGFFVALFLSLISFGLSGQLFRTIKVDFKKIPKSLKVLFTNRLFLSIFLFVLNVFIYLKIGFQTVIPLYILNLLYLIPIVVVLLLTLFVFKSQQKYKLWFNAMCLTPFCIGLFLCINFFLSSNTVQEKYKFRLQKEISSSGYRYNHKSIQRETTLMELEWNAYEDCKGIRMFIDYDNVKDKRAITYTMANGLFGIKVMKSYRLH